MQSLLERDELSFFSEPHVPLKAGEDPTPFPLSSIEFRAIAFHLHGRKKFLPFSPEK